MSAKRFFIALLLLTGTAPALAETPRELLAVYSAEAAKGIPGFTPSADHGRDLFTKKWGVSGEMPSCTACHGKDMHAEGKHVITGKIIAPLTPTVNPERFTSAKKVAKWFKRNCTEVLGRECTAAEKADFIQFAIMGGKV